MFELPTVLFEKMIVTFQKYVAVLCFTRNLVVART